MELDFFIDIHTHSTMMNGFMYGNIYDDSIRYERQAIFPKLLCSNADDFSIGSTQFNRDSVKAGTGRRTLGGSLDENCLCYTLEVSFFSYQPVGFSQPIPYTEEGYMKLGRNLARTFLDYYKLQNYISFKPQPSLTTSKTNNLQSQLNNTIKPKKLVTQQQQQQQQQTDKSSTSNSNVSTLSPASLTKENGNSANDNTFDYKNV
jgi:cytosolic carboxypeptidase protein 6